MTLVFDTTTKPWAELFEWVSQSGASTGNNEAETYAPSGCELVNNQLHLHLQAASGMISGKCRSRLTLNQLVPSGRGALEVTFERPHCEFRGKGHSDYCYGLWPAIWLLPDSGSVGGWPCGGELDLWESMHRSPGQEGAGFATAHFGPRVGADYIYDGAWGGSLAHFQVAGNTQHVLRFEWHQLAPGLWQFQGFMDGQLLWTRTTNESYNLGQEPGRFRNGMQPSNFTSGPGSPQYIFSRAFEEPSRGLRLIMNLAIGGTPFGGREAYDHDLVSATFPIHQVQIWQL